MSNKKPGIYIPTLYFAEGLPYAIVMMMSGVFFKSLGASNVFIGLCTLLSLPWSFKFLWAPLVDFKGTKRLWVLFAQISLAVLCTILAAVVYFGVPDTGLGLAIFKTFVDDPAAMAGVTDMLALAVLILALIALASATHDISIDGYYLDVLNKDQQSFYVGIRSAAYKMAWLFATGAMVWFAGYLEKIHGLTTGWACSFLVMAGVLGALALFHSWYLPRNQGASALLFREPDVALVAGSGQTAAVSGTQAGSISSSQSASTNGGDSSSAQALPSVPNHGAMTGGKFVSAIITYFNQPQSIAIVCYILLFRLGDALMLKQATNFLQDPVTKGGMGLSVQDIGILYGTVGVVFLLVGGLVGGWLLSKDGLRKWFWPLALFQNSAIILYFLLATMRPGIEWLYVVNSIEQFAYGLGVSAFMVFILRTVNTEFKAAHYAVATGLMTLGMLIPGTLSGYLYQSLGYANFFLVSFLLSIPGMITIFFLPYWREDEKRDQPA
ncbi:MAG: MFS transporter [Candidatus Obscuribacterales bacterium]|nr:MFS transporter [Candidatus Obscuribacterales bacterium]